VLRMCFYVLPTHVQCWNLTKITGERGGGSDGEMFEILHKDPNLKQTFTQKMSVCRHELGATLGNSNPARLHGFDGDDDLTGSPPLSERAALHVVLTADQPKSAAPRSAGVDPMYAVLASTDLAVVLAVSLGAVLVAIAIILALVFLASRRRRARQFQRRLKEISVDGRRFPGSSAGFTRSSDSHPGIALSDGPTPLANGGHHLLQRATSSASGRQLNVAFAPDVNIELEVSYIVFDISSSDISHKTNTVTSLKFFFIAIPVRICARPQRCWTSTLTIRAIRC